MDKASDDYLRAYQESGLSHVTIFIAFMFGLFSILPFMKDMAEKYTFYFFLLSITYWLLWLGGLYCLGKFFLYLELRDYVITKKNKQRSPDYRESYIKDWWKNSNSNYRKKLSGLANFSLVGGLFREHSLVKITVIISLYFFMAYTPYLVVILNSFWDLPFLWYMIMYIIFLVDIAIPSFCISYVKIHK